MGQSVIAFPLTEKQPLQVRPLPRGSNRHGEKFRKNLSPPKSPSWERVLRQPCSSATLSCGQGCHPHAEVGSVMCPLMSDPDRMSDTSVPPPRS